MMERRKYERFALRLRGDIMAVDLGGEEVLDVVTSDVSAGGAFLYTQKTETTGTRVQVRLNVASNRLRELTGAHGLLKVAGTVVRSGTEGIAIFFNGEPEVVPIAIS
jgi:hypothetical protein